MKLQSLVSRYLKLSVGLGLDENSPPAPENASAAFPPHDSTTEGAPWSSQWNEFFEERAAIMEHDGNMDRDEAERLALEDLERQFH